MWHNSSASTQQNTMQQELLRQSREQHQQFVNAWQQRQNEQKAIKDWQMGTGLTEAERAVRVQQIQKANEEQQAEKKRKEYLNSPECRQILVERAREQQRERKAREDVAKEQREDIAQEQREREPRRKEYNAQLCQTNRQQKQGDAPSEPCKCHCVML